MKPIWTVVIAVVALVVGLFVGGLLGTGVGAGVGAGAGIVVGSQAGICIALEEAEAAGWIPANQVESFIGKTVEKTKTLIKLEKLPKDVVWLKGKGDCDRVRAEAEKG